jgi:hypothetical protein
MNEVNRQDAEGRAPARPDRLRGRFPMIAWLPVKRRGKRYLG